MNKVEYDKSKCIGCGVCEMLAPHIWAMNTVDGKADMLDTDTTKGQFRDVWPDEIEVMTEIIRSCPPTAIKQL